MACGRPLIDQTSNPNPKLTRFARLTLTLKPSDGYASTPVGSHPPPPAPLQGGGSQVDSVFISIGGKIFGFYLPSGNGSDNKKRSDNKRVRNGNYGSEMEITGPKCVFGIKNQIDTYHFIFFRLTPEKTKDR